MKKIIAFLFIISLVSADLFAQNWQWAVSDGCKHVETTKSLCTDVYGNIYVSGDFGNGPAPTYFGVFAGDTLYVQGKTDIFVASYSPNGNGKWAKRAGSNSMGNGVTYLLESGFMLNNKADSSLLLYGYYAGDFSLDTFFFPGNLYSTEFFISKMNYQGDCMWVKRATSLPGDGSLYTMSSDQSGRPYLMGATISGGVLDTFNIASGVFAARISSDGDFLWAKSDFWKTGFWQIEATSLGFIATGIFFDTAYVDTIPVISAGSNDILIASFDSLGSAQWAKSFGGPNFEFKSRLSLDAVGNIYITAYFTDSIYFDTTLLTHPGKDVFLAKFDPSGNFLWARQLHASGNAESYDIDADVDGNVYITGFFSQSATFGSHTITGSSANYSMFLARYNSQGDCLGVRYVENAIGTNVLNEQSSVIVSGTFSDSVSLGNNTIISNGLSDMFIARHDAFTGVGEFQGLRKSSLFIYANPSNGKCTITIPEEFQYESNLVLSILDRNGRTIKEYSIEMHDGKIRLNLETEAKGIYIARLSNGVKQYTGRSCLSDKDEKDNRIPTRMGF